MGIFDSIQNLIGGAADLAQNSIGEAMGGIADIPALQEIQEQASNITDGAGEAVTSVTDQGQNVVDNISQNIGL